MHSYRGSQYCVKLFQTALKAFGRKSSMSRKGNYRDKSLTVNLWRLPKRVSIYGPICDQLGSQSGGNELVGVYNAMRLNP